MDHDKIEDQGWAARYLAGTLAPAEEEAFEQHLLLCAECQERVEIEETLRDGVRAWTAEQVARQAAVRAGAFAWLTRRARGRGMGLAMTAITTLAVVALVVPALLLHQVAQLRGELAQTRAVPAHQSGAPTALPQPRPAGDSSAAARGTEPSAPISGAVAPAAPAGASALDEARSLARLEDQLAAERRAAAAAAAGERSARQEGARLASELAAERRPRIDTPIVTMSPLRSAGAGGAAGAPTARVPLSGAAGWVTLALELESPRAPAYAVTLARAGGGAVVWHGEGLHPDANDALTLSLPVRLLAPGDYEIAVDALGGAGPPPSSQAGQPPARVARFVFRALPTP